MISSLSMNSMSMMGTRSMQRQPPPPPDKDVFKVADSDSDGLVSSSELENLAAGIEKITGNSIVAEDALSTYDANGDGGLSGEELFELMSSQGFNPAGFAIGEEGDSEMTPPPPPPQQVSSAYLANSADDSISQLIDLLQNQSDSEEGYSSVELSV